MSSLRPIAGFLLLLAAVGGCSTRGPQAPPARLVQRPDSALNEVDLRVKALPPVGDTMPVLVTIANITLKSFSLNADRVCAVSADGNRVSAMPLAAAEQSASGGERLAAALPNLHPTPPPPPPPSTGQMIADVCFAPFTSKPAGDPRFGAAWIMFVCPRLPPGPSSTPLSQSRRNRHRHEIWATIFCRVAICPRIAISRATFFCPEETTPLSRCR